MLLIIFLCTSYTYAQKSENPNKIEQVTVVLKDEAKIFSTDEAFNKQITDNVIILKNADVVPVHKNSGNVLEVIASKSEILKKDLNKQVSVAVEKIQKEEIKKVEKEIDQHKERKKTFKISSYKGFPSSDEFIATTHSNKDSVVPNYNNYDFSNIFLDVDSYVFKRSLNYLYTEGYARYNHRSIDYCFSEVFSVRPPPLHF